jgi:hypothetical protein
MKITLESLEEIGPFAWPGGYVNTFIDRDGSILCFDCAKKDLQDGNPFGSIAYAGYEERDPEDGDVICDGCGQEVDPAIRGRDDDPATACRYRVRGKDVAEFHTNVWDEVITEARKLRGEGIRNIAVEERDHGPGFGPGHWVEVIWS